MEHLTLKAVTTTTDQGLFDAVISTERSDREKDVVSAPAMVTALRKWNRPLPLAWAHSTEAEHIFGAIDTQSAKDVGVEVVVSGQVDMESRVGKEAWRSFKQRTIGFSFGYLILQSTNIKGGGRNITELDVYEITATPTPMNNDTRVLSTKAVDDKPTEEQLRRQLFEVELERAMTGRAKRSKGTDKPVHALPAEVLDSTQKILAYLEQNPEQAGEADVILKRAVEQRKAKLAPFEHVKSKIDFKKLTHEEKLALYHALVELGDLADIEKPEGQKAIWTAAYITNLPQDIKDQMEQKTPAVDDGSDDEPERVKSAPQDPLRKRTDELALELASDGLSRRKYVAPAPEPEPEPLDERELRRRTDELRLHIASG